MKHNVGRIILPASAGKPYSQVPTWIFSLKLSEQARLLLAWAAGKPPRWIPQVRDICDTLHFGPDKWRRLVAELSQLDVISQSRSRDGGKTTHALIIDLRPVAPDAQHGRAVARDPLVLRSDGRRTTESGDPCRNLPSELEEGSTKTSTTAAARRRIGWQLQHPRHGLLTVYGDAGHWLSESGVIVGTVAWQIWAQVQRGELELRPPVFPAAMHQLVRTEREVGIK